jgi:sugar-specific transcriptional regulator TrmB
VLTTLGFNETEALVYCDLLKNPGSTGYRVARSINKAQANTYQTLNSLVQKGAAVFEEGDTRSFRATPPAELLARLRREFEQQFDTAQTSLTQLEAKAADDERIYQLRNTDQVIERARAMLAAAEETISFSWFPSWAQELRDDLAQAVGRGVAAAGLILRPEDDVPGAKCVLSKIADVLVDIWPGEQIILVIDGRQFLLALADSPSGELRQAYWARNAFLATIMHNALSSDTLVHGSNLILEIGGSIQRHLYGKLTPGFRDMHRGEPPSIDDIPARTA